MAQIQLLRLDLGDVSPVLLEFAAESIGIDAVVMPVAKSHHNGKVLTAQAGATEQLSGVLPMRRQMTTILKLDGKNKTLAVLDLPDIHTLDADNLSTQFVGYFLSNSLTAVVHDDN